MCTSQTRMAARGFTLMETLMVMAVIGALAAMTAVGFSYMTNRARASNAVFSVVSMFPLAQSRAPAQGRDQYVVVYEKLATEGTQRGVYVMDFPSAVTPPADWTTVDFAEPTSFGATMVEHIRLQSTDTEGGAYLALASNPFGGALPAPFSAISLTAPGSSGLLSACSHCVSGTGNSAGGVVRFGADARMKVLTGDPTAAGVALGLGEIAGAQRLRLVAVSSPAGAVRVFE